MKNLVKALFVFAVSAFVLTSCNKEKQAVNRLDGTWELKSASVSEEGADCGGTTVEATTTWAFTAYTVGEDESGQVISTSTVSGTSTSDTLDYSVNEDASEFTLGSGTAAQTWMINKLTKSNFEVEMTQTQSVLTECPDSTNLFGTYEDKSVTTTLTLEKQ